MKTATQNLEDDHVHILRLIDVMESMTHASHPDPAHLETALDLVRHFADGLHHAKEENLLFPLMVEKGFSFEQGPVAVMMHDHVEGRNFVKAAAENIILYKNGDTKALQHVFDNMNGYIFLLRSHIAKENNVLFRMADKVFSEQEQKSLLADFEAVEAEQGKADFQSRIDKLAAIYL
jgi:hemerythrin-like domain-containing protein